MKQSSALSDESITNDPRWAQVQARDQSADGIFWYSVATTGVYCRPSCPSRPANPKNIAFHDTTENAKSMGFRACKRCKPDVLSADSQNIELVAQACRLIERSSEELSLKELADSVSLSTSYFQRTFKSIVGLSPKEYAAGLRANKVREELEPDKSVTESMYNAGFNSTGRFYEQSNQILGMTPTNYRAGGLNEQIKFAVGQTSLGAVLVASSQKGVVAILLGDEPEDLVIDFQKRFPKAELVGADKEYEALIAQVVGMIESPSRALELPLDTRGTAFQCRVWNALRKIPAGKTATYAEVAKTIGSPKAVRAVASACAANNLAVAIPCHRVVRTDGALSGYAWGVDRKRSLIAKEAREVN